MRRRLFSWLAALLLLAGVSAPLPAQTTPAAPAAAERPLPVLEYGIAFVLTVVILLVVCYPARNNSYS